MMTNGNDAGSDTNLPLEDRMQLIALRVLAEAEGPSGALSLAGAFRSAGIDVAEATAGRYLRQLDELGFTRSLGKRGRILTPQGEDRLAELVQSGSLAAHGARVTAAVGGSTIQQLIDLLHVRRAVEIEAAGLAAQRATEAEVAEIVAAAMQHVDCVEASSRAVSAHNFHELISRYSHNEMLAAMTMMLLDPRHDPLAKLLDHIADNTGTAMSMALDHPRIAEAIRERDPAEAEHAMRRHLDKLIAVVRGYRDSMQVGG
ncbi:FCD domain-containing protein [Bosea sp. RAF48]|uniref:FadR/GntR family transcriptional regulator n=1 Tax=Bosea sp. RAF48 TaxID=3237480 RepID=UPI003F9391F7